MNKILIIEDDPVMGDMMRMYLSGEGYSVERALTGAEGSKLLASFRPDIVLLDLMLPDIDGRELCIRFRETSDVPIMVVSMRSEVSERIRVLQAGADDYLCKPFSLHELAARIFALLRRAGAGAWTARHAAEAAALAGKAHRPNGQTRAPDEPIRLDLERRLLFVRGKPVETTFSEFELMKLLLAYPGKVFSREELINAIRGFDSFVTDRAIDVHIVNLRKKVEENARTPRYIRTVWGVGYKFMRD